MRLYRRAKRAEETERADAQHENRGLTFWHEDDGTVVLHGRFPPEMGARILGALDAAMAAHAEEQPAAGWDDEGGAPEDVPRGTSGPGPAAAGAATVTDVRDRADAGRRRDAEVFLTDVPRGTFIRGPVAHGAPRRCAGVDGRAGVRIGRCVGARVRPARNRGPCRGRSARERRRRDAAKSSTAPPLRRRPPEGCAAMPESSL